MLSRLADEAKVDINRPKLVRPTPRRLPDGRYLVEGTLAGNDMSWSGDWGGQHAMLMFMTGREEARKLARAIAVMDGEEDDNARAVVVGADDGPDYPDYPDEYGYDESVEETTGRDKETVVAKATRTDEEKWWEEDDVDGDECDGTIDVNLSGDDNDRVRLCAYHG